MTGSGHSGVTRAPVQTAVIHHQLPFRSEAYTLAHFVEDQQPAEGAGHSGMQSYTGVSGSLQCYF